MMLALELGSTDTTLQVRFVLGLVLRATALVGQQSLSMLIVMFLRRSHIGHLRHPTSPQSATSMRTLCDSVHYLCGLCTLHPLQQQQPKPPADACKQSPRVAALHWSALSVLAANLTYEHHPTRGSPTYGIN